MSSLKGEHPNGKPQARVKGKRSWKKVGIAGKGEPLKWVKSGRRYRRFMEQQGGTRA